MGNNTKLAHTDRENSLPKKSQSENNNENNLLFIKSSNTKNNHVNFIKYIKITTKWKVAIWNFIRRQNAVQVECV